MKLLRVIRFDPSDTFVFERAAEPGEWAVPGTFAFAPMDVASLQGKARAAFRCGFLGISSLGWSTLVEAVEADDADRNAAVDLLARRLVERFDAPDLAVARAAAEEEIAFAASLGEHTAPGTVVALGRKHENGDIRETFRTLAAGAASKPARAFVFEATSEEEEEAPAEKIDLLNLAKGSR